MRMNKFLMLGIAGLAFAACSNEEEFSNGTPTPTGEGAVTVKIISPAMTKATAIAPSEGTGSVENVKVTGEMTIELTCDNGPLTKKIQITDGTIQEDEVTFWNVTNPTLVKAYINDGRADYSDIDINAEKPNMQAAPASVPVYGEAKPTLTTTVRPGVGKDDDGNENVTDDGTDVNKNYSIFTADITLKIPVARLEVSGITHVDHSGSACAYKDLKITGVYLDNLRMTSDDDVSTDYKLPGDDVAGADTDSPLYTLIDPAEDFDSKTKWPHSETLTTPVFGYNFYASEGGKASENPHFKIRFTYSDETGTVTSQTRYATIKTYQDANQQEVAMKNGHIYKVTAAAIDDDNLKPGEDGEDLYAVTVTVTEAQWEVNTVTGVWEK